MSIGRLAALVALSAGAAAIFPSCFAVGDSDADPPKKTDAGTDADAANLADGAWPCAPKSCAQVNADCGDTSDGCGNIIPCGSCPSGQTCGAGGPNRCGVGTCTPTTCATAGADCGLVGDGCGKSLDCGNCAPPKSCGASGQVNKCGCTPTTCALEGKDCGNIPDDCGGTLDCGTCASGKKCGAGGVANVCACEPTTCAIQGKSCGTIPDGCGGNLSCGSCTAPKTCGGLGTPNICACSPQNCPPIFETSFELPSDFPTGWVFWQNCPTDTAWTVTRDVYPAPSGGSWNLRLHSTAFLPSCQYPGVYAASPPVTALPGRVYRVENMSRNASNVGSTDIIFYDAADQEIGAQQVTWTTDAWQYNADPVLTATSPANTKALRIRFGLQSPSEYADLDLLEVYLEPL